QEMLDSEQLHAGMRPKVRSIVQALGDGVPQAHILDGRVLHAILIEMFTDEGVGTMVTSGGGGPDGVTLEVDRIPDAAKDTA
ncbi:MAG: acetylglutamate kinase, partial [Myxococcota bacterium]